MQVRMWTGEGDRLRDDGRSVFDDPRNWAPQGEPQEGDELILTARNGTVFVPCPRLSDSVLEQLL